MIPNLNQVDRPQSACIGKIRADGLDTGTWFLAALEMRGKLRLYVKVFDAVVDVQIPLDTYGNHILFYNVQEVGVRIDYWKR